MRTPPSIVLVSVLALYGCGNETEEVADAATPDATVDAVPIDAPVDTGPSSCATTAEMLLDVSPRRLSHLVPLDGLLYLSTYQTDISGTPNGGELLSLNPTSRATQQVLTHQGRVTSMVVHAGALYAIKGGGGAGMADIVRYQPGGSPETVVADRPNPYALAVDGVDAFWREGSQASPQLMRRALSGGTPASIRTADVYDLDVDDVYLYVAHLSQAAYRIPKAGGNPQFYRTPTYGAVKIAVVPPYVYYLEFLNNLYRADLATGTTTVHAHTDAVGRMYGFVFDGSWFYVTTDRGIDRVPAAGGSFETIWPGATADASDDPVLLGGKLYWNTYAQVYSCTP